MAFLMSLLHLWTYKLTSARLLRFLSLKCIAGPSMDNSLFRMSNLKKLMQSFLTKRLVAYSRLYYPTL